jgi:hypothetical protein
MSPPGPSYGADLRRESPLVSYGVLGGTRTPSLLIRRVCRAVAWPARPLASCDYRSHQFATFLAVSRCHTAKIRPLGLSAPIADGFGGAALVTLSMRTTGACQVGTSSAGSQRCLRSCMRAVVRPCCCTFCCTRLTCSRRTARPDSCQLTSLQRPWPLRRSQVAVRTASGAACLTWDRPSVSVCWRPPLAMAIVTHWLLGRSRGYVMRVCSGDCFGPLSTSLCPGRTG